MKPVTLALPPAHSIEQYKLINAWECRIHPDEKKLNPLFVPDNPTPITAEFTPSWLPSGVDAKGLPLMFPGLRFIVGACGTKELASQFSN